MSEFGNDILRALADLGPTAIELKGLARERWPTLTEAASAAELEALATRGLIVQRADGLGTISAQGLQYIARQPAPASAPAKRPEPGGEPSARPAPGIPAGSPAPIPPIAPVTPVAAPAAVASPAAMSAGAAVRAGVLAPPRGALESTVGAAKESRGGIGPIVQDASALPNTTDAEILENRLERLRLELDALTQEISAATSVPMDAWSEALEVTANVEQSLDRVRKLLVAGR